MERADPLFLLMGLPAIPVVLVLGKMIHWEDYIVRLWQKLYYRGKFPLVAHCFSPSVHLLSLHPLLNVQNLVYHVVAVLNTQVSVINFCVNNIKLSTVCRTFMYLNDLIIYTRFILVFSSELPDLCI